MAKEKYNHKEIEKKAQELWAEKDLYAVDIKNATKPYYLLVEFPYPSGDLHVGHWYAFAVTDIFARFKRMQGFDVLFPFGFDAFGLPAENAAIKRGLDPRKWTYENMESMTRQVKTMGSSFDWSKQLATCDPEYYRWTQWLFSRLYEKGLAYRGTALVNWDPVDMTVLANEQVLPDGTAERSGAVVEKKELEQWFMGITQYADRLINDLDDLPWREEIKVAQKAWIGKSEGAVIDFTITNKDGSETESISVFTTRPDTLFGVTFLLLAPEHGTVQKFLASTTITNSADVEKYVRVAKSKTDRERMQGNEKSGVLLEGITATHPISGASLPIYIADYVIGGYGTGAVMAVPAHDERDHAFATKFNLPIISVVDPVTGSPHENAEPKKKIVSVVENEAGEILTIHWKPELGGRLLVGGTVDNDDEYLETALREIAEETGYTDLTLIEEALETVHHEYFAYSKNKAFDARVKIFHFKASTSTIIATALEGDEIGKFTVEWVSPDVAKKEITDPLHYYAIERFLNGVLHTGEGILANSGEFTGQSNIEAAAKIVEAAGGKFTTQYRLRDWLISRQRYWGCPIPVVYDPEGTAHLVPSEHLPWLLPEDVDFTLGKHASPLMSSVELKERVTRIFGEGWTPEYDTLDTFVDSSWYFMRYLDVENTETFADLATLQKWMPVDRYSGGSEHTTLHLLYARFFNKALFDLGLAPTSEPFIERMNRGLIADSNGQKMSKSKGNTINPDEPVQQYGADAVRMYLAFIGPYNEPGTYPWKPEGVEAMRRFLDRVNLLKERVSDEISVTPDESILLARASDKMSSDIERFKLNTAVSAFMILMNDLEKQSTVSSAAYLHLLTLLAPFAPHLAEGLYGELGLTTGGNGKTYDSIHQIPWPAFDPALLKTQSVTIGIQVAGKRRGEMTISAEATLEEAVSEAKNLPQVAALYEAGQEPRVVYVPGKIFNIVP